MPTKPDTILKKIDSLPDHQSKLCLKFKEWLEYENDNSERNWITPDTFATIKRKKNKRISSYSPIDVWSIDELLTIVKYCTNPRYKAILTISWDMAARNHEMVKLRLKDIVFKEKYPEVTTWDTKTGMRISPLIISFPYLRELINIHPFANSPDAFLILSHINNKPLSSNSIWGNNK